MKTTAAVALAWLLAGSAGARAEIVTNGGFETGDLSGWTLSGNADFIGVLPGIQNSGVYGAYLGPAGAPGFLSQDFADVPGQLISISFALDPTPPVYGPAYGKTEFLVQWNGLTVMDLVDPGVSESYAPYAIQVIASGHDSLSFGARNDSSFFDLDDVVVTQVPEPGGLGLLTMSLAGMLGLRRRHRRAAS